MQKRLLFVGMAGFEPTTSCSQSRRDTGLRYIPNLGITFFDPYLKVESNFCRDGRIRTYDLLLPKQARYRATLHPELGIFFFDPFAKGLQRNDFLFKKTINLKLLFKKRRGRDSNPRYRCQYDSLANCSFRPLRHLSFLLSKCPFRGCKYSNSLMFAKKNYTVC